MFAVIVFEKKQNRENLRGLFFAGEKEDLYIFSAMIFKKISHTATTEYLVRVYEADELLLLQNEGDSLDAEEVSNKTLEAFSAKKPIETFMFTFFQ